MPAWPINAVIGGNVRTRRSRIGNQHGVVRQNVVQIRDQAFLPGWLLPTLGASVVIGMIFASIPVSLTMYFVENASAEDYGPGFSAATLAFGVAQMVSPQIGGLLADWTSTFLWVLLLSATCALLGIVGALRLPKFGTSTPQPLPTPPDHKPLVAPSVFSVRPH